MNVTGISGGLSAPSRTRGLVEAILEDIEQRYGQPTALVDLAESATAFGAALDPRELAPVAATHLRQIAQADLLVVATPVYKAAYPGLFKHVFDLLDRHALEGKVVILAANGASAHHALIIESHLRPLLSSLGAYTAPTGIYTQTDDFSHYALVNPAIRLRIGEAVREAWALRERLQPVSAPVTVTLSAA